MSRSKTELANEFALRMGAISNIYTEVLQKVVDRAGIRPDRLNVLMLVRSQPDREMTFGDLEKRTGFRKYQITRIADWLEKSGLATVDVDPGDRRSRRLKASQSGFKSAGDIAQEIVTRILGSGYEQGRVEQICSQLAALNDALIGWGPSLWPELLDTNNTGRRRRPRNT